MLLQFTVGNYRSFRERVTFSLVAEPREIGHENSLTPISGDPGAPKALSLAALYGANASGKSNLLRAIDFLRRLVVEGTRPYEPIPVDRFLLTEQKKIEPSFFEIHFFWQNEVYTYGLECDVGTIHREWLHAGLNDTHLFTRVTNGETVSVNVSEEFAERSGVATDRWKFIVEGTRPNQLLLKQALDQNVGLLQDIAYWFKIQLLIIWPDAKGEHEIIQTSESEPNLNGLSSFLQAVDTGIERVEFSLEEYNVGQLPDWPRHSIEFQLLRRDESYMSFFLHGDRITLKLDAKQGKAFRLRYQAIQKGSKGISVPMDWSLQSDGTRRMTELWEIIFQYEIIGTTLLVDEIERSLHPELMRYFLERLRERPHTQNQLIFTTHNDNFLEDDLLRRDEVWFVEKDREGGSRLTSEVEYKPLEGVTRQRAYLDGMYGGTPRIPVRRFHWQDRGKV